MNRIRRSLNAAVNPMSTAATRWWCHSALRHTLTGHGPTPSQRRLTRPVDMLNRIVFTDYHRLGSEMVIVPGQQNPPPPEPPRDGDAPKPSAPPQTSPDPPSVPHFR